MARDGPFFGECSSLCLQPAARRWATEGTEPPFTGIEPLFSPPTHSSVGCFLRTSGLLMGCPWGVRLQGSSAKHCVWNPGRGVAFYKESLLKCWPAKQKSYFQRLRYLGIFQTKCCQLIPLMQNDFSLLKSHLKCIMKITWLSECKRTFSLYYFLHCCYIKY